MDQFEFIERLKKYGIERDIARYRESLFSPIEASEEDSVEGRFKKSIQSLSKEEQEYFLTYTKIVSENSIGIILSLLDGSSNIGVSGKFQLYYEQDGQRYHINNKDGDMLMTLLYDEDEE
jgi:hypothetical protein